MNIFLAFPFTQLIDKKSNRLNTKTVKFLEDLRNQLIDNGHTVFLAHYREKWGKELMTPEECTADDYREMIKADIVIAFPGFPISGGVHIELGWASALKKSILIFLEKDKEYSPLLTALYTISNTHIYQYEKMDVDIYMNIINQHLIDFRG